MSKRRHELHKETHLTALFKFLKQVALYSQLGAPSAEDSRQTKANFERSFLKQNNFSPAILGKSLGKKMMFCISFEDPGKTGSDGSVLEWSVGR